MTVVGGFLVCGLGLQSGVERITKVMMLCLLALIVVLAVHSAFLEGGGPGLSFYLLPDWERAAEAGIGNVASAAMNQAFFTLSLGIAAIEIFGSYMSDDFTLGGEAVRIAMLDTFVAIMAGLIISRHASPMMCSRIRGRLSFLLPFRRSSATCPWDSSGDRSSLSS